MWLKIDNNVACFFNSKNKKTGPYPDRHKEILSLAGYRKAYEVISQWNGYGMTPLRDLPGMAKQLEVGAVFYKDEAARFGLDSFKALGGAYAVFNLLCREIIKKGLAKTPSIATILSGEYADFINTITVASATDGNHGRSVAWGASMFGCRAVIYIHSTVSKEREQAIAKYGAKVVRTTGNYDHSVAQASREAKKNEWFVVSDTSYPGYTEVPKDVMQGYSVMAQEAIDQLDGVIPTHLFIQGGVGGLAAAVTAHFWETFGKKCPKIIVVEPSAAACLYESAKEGKPVAVEGSLDTIMAGLACGEVSIIAFSILKDAVDAFLVISDDAAAEAMRLCARGNLGDKFVAGESAVAGLAGAIISRQDESLAKELGLNQASRILLFGSEGATSPQIYEKIVGQKAADI